MYDIFHNLYVLQLVVIFIDFILLFSPLVLLSLSTVNSCRQSSMSSLVDLCCQMLSYNCCHRCILALSVFCFHAKVLLLFLFSFSLGKGGTRAHIRL